MYSGMHELILLTLNNNKQIARSELGQSLATFTSALLLAALSGVSSADSIGASVGGSSAISIFLLQPTNK